ncbi:MAG TPA: ferritin-like domain-containing protein [Polyangiaceae bacterium]
MAALAAAATAGCGNSGGGPNGTPNVSCPEPTITVTAAQACQVLDEDYVVNEAMGYPSGPTCTKLCADGGGGLCDLSQSFVSAVQSLNPDASVGPDDAGTRMLACPTSPATTTVTCVQACGGRLTEGYRAPDGVRDEGQRLAALSYLEAVSVYAFERLASELEVHRAPAQLLRAARRARRDEVRHTAMTARLARERGGCPRSPEAPASNRTRPLLEMALENAVEGCVRETYGAVQGLIEAQTSRDRGIRRAMKSIASDECRHAELAWAVHAWAMPRLSANERLHVERGMRDAIAEIAARDPRTASLLFS